jgi:3-oxoacyl-[acyl-carrier-protein] synthase II
MQKIAITGTGVVTCVGNSVPRLWQNICDGQSGMCSWQPKSTVLQTRSLGLVKDFDLYAQFDPKWHKKIDRHVKFSLNATADALQQSGLDIQKVDPHRVHSVIGTTAGSYDFITENQQRLDAGRPVLPNFIAGHINNMMSAYINMHWGIRGSGLGISGACAAGGQAISLAAMLIESQQADVVITGASDAWLSEVVIGGMESLGALSFNQILPRPFHRQRDGFAMSEGAAILVLENAQHAQRRGADILAYLSGWGISSDAYHATSPDPENSSFVHMVHQALGRAKLNAKDIDYVNAHATGTRIGDAVECRGLRRVFGDRPWISGTKSMTGHSIGSSSAIESVISIMSLKQGCVPGTINLDDIDSDCPGRHATETMDSDIKHVMSTSFGFGGTNNALIFSKR